MQPQRHSTSLLVAVLVVFFGLAARLLLDPLFGDRVPFFTFWPAIFAAAWWGGIWPALYATLISLPVMVYFIMPPRQSFTIEMEEHRVGLLLFAVMGILIGWFGEQLHKSRKQATTSRDKAVAERERLRVTIASIGDGVIVTDESGRITAMNSVAESLTAWKQSRALGTQLTEVFNIINEDSRQKAEDPCSKVLRTGAVVGLANHTLLLAADGTERPIDDSAAPILDQLGKTVGVVVVFRDVTAKRYAERALARSERELKDFFENAALPLHSVGPDGTILRVNQAELDFLGYSREEYVGRHIAEFHADRAVIDDILARLTRGEILHNYEARLLAKDGSLKDVLISSSVLWDDGQFVHTRCFTRDITDRKQAEKALAFLADASSTLAILADRTSALQQAARATLPFLADWCVVIAYDAQGHAEQIAHAHADPQQEMWLSTLLADGPLDWRSAADHLPALQGEQSQLIDELPETLLTQLVSSEEQRQAIRALKPHSIIRVPIEVRGRMLGALTLAASDPARRYSERELRLAENFAHRVATAIDNAQLVYALKENDRHKDEFLAMLAHELRNPLAAIRYAAVLGRMPNGEPPEQLFELVERQTQSLAHLVDDLVDVSRISRDKIRLRKELIDVAAVVQRAVASARSLIEQKQHNLTLSLPKDSLALVADPTRAEQIVANLLINAAKYTPPGGRLKVEAHADDGEVVIKVSDNGIGIPPDMLGRIFDLFTQADRTLDRSEGGLGIGLTVARRLAEMHGGSLSASSDSVGRGAQFTLRLPKAGDTAPGVSPVPTSVAALSALRILVVDDNQDTANSMALLLTATGHQVQTANDGRQALALARDFRPQVFLLDIGLPGMNGFELASQLRENSFENALIVAISGYGQREDRQRSREAGFDEHLVKPVDYAHLLTVLHAAMPASQTAQP